MSNMKYCKFENTVEDVADCIEAFENANWDIDYMMLNASTKDEARSIKQFVRLCKHIAEVFDEDRAI